MNPLEQFDQEKHARIEALGKDIDFKEKSQQWLLESMRKKYPYNFSWLGVPIIQTPMDIVAMQELVWQIKPDLIIETGIAHGGSLILYSSLLELNALAGGPADALVLGIDIDIRAHNHEAILQHRFAKRIQMLQGSSVDPKVVSQVHAIAKSHKTVLVCLDSMHTHEHVLAELHAYAPLVSKNSYCVVFDTFVEDMPADLYPDRPWAPGNNPKTAVHQFLKHNSAFRIDHSVADKLMVTVAPDGFLQRVN